MKKFRKRILSIMVLGMSLFIVSSFTLAFQDDFTQADAVKDNPRLPMLVAIFGGYDETREFKKIVFSPDEQYVVTLQQDSSEALIWEIARSFNISKIYTDSEISDVAFHPFRNELYTSHSDGTIQVWDIESGQLLRTHSVANTALGSIAFFAGQPLLLVTDTTNEVRLIEPVDGTLLQIMETQGVPADIVFDSGGDQMATLTPSSVHVYDVNRFTGEPEMTITLPANLGVPAGLAFSANGEAIVVGFEGEVVQTYNLSDGSQEATITSGLSYLSMFDDPVVTTLPVVGSDGGVYFQNIQTSDTTSAPKLISSVVHKSILSVNPDGSIAVMAIANEPQRPPAISLFDVNTGEEFYFFGNTLDAQFSPSGQILLNVTNEGKMLLFAMR